MRTYNVDEKFTLFYFLQKCEELDTFPCTFAWHLHLMEQKLNILHSFLASAKFDDFKLNLGETPIQCFVIPFVNIWFMFYYSNWLCLIFLHFNHRWIHLNVPWAFRPHSGYNPLQSLDTDTDTETGLLNISDQHLL